MYVLHILLERIKFTYGRGRAHSPSLYAGTPLCWPRV